MHMHDAAARGVAAGQLLRGRAADIALREAVAPLAFLAAILVSNYALAGLPNVKLFDLLVFVAGYTLGFRRGAAVAIGAWLVYGRFNPWGAAHAQLLATMMAAETGYALMGALVRLATTPSALRLRPGRLSVALVVAAMLATVFYDVTTNIYTGYFWATIAGSDDYGRWINTALSNPGAVFFMAVHVGSNAVLFPVFGPPLMKGAAWAKRALSQG